MRGFTTVGLTIPIVYLAAVLLAGLPFSKKEMRGKEFFKGDDTTPRWVTPVSIFATLLSPISSLSLAGNFYAGTWIMWFAQLGMLVAILITIKFFLPIYSKLDIDTVYYYLEIRFGGKDLHVPGAVMLIVHQVGRTSIIMYLPFMVPSKLTDLNVNLPIIAMGVITIIYSYIGGLKSVPWTDFIQDSVLLVGVTFALFYLVNGINSGLGAIFQTMGEDKSLVADQSIFNPNTLKDSVLLLTVGVGLSTCSSYVFSRDIVQCFTTTIDTKKLNKMMLTNSVLSIFITTVFHLIGIGLYVLYSQDVLLSAAQQDQIFVSYVAYEFLAGVTGLFPAVIYAALQSTLSTGLNSVATNWALDIQERPSKKEMSFVLQTKIAQYVSLGVGIVAILVSMALANGEIRPAYEWFNGFVGLVLGMPGGTFALGTFTKVANAKGACVAFFVAAVAMVCIKYMAPVGSISIWSYSIISTAISLVAGIPASMITRKMDGDASKPVKDATTCHN